MFRRLICINALLMAQLALVFFVYPPVRAFVSIRDPALRGPGVPAVAWRLHANLSKRYAAWAQKRISSGRASALSTQDISGTEWPLFGSLFFLWGTENLQAAWDGGDRRAAVEPRVTARDAIVAASELIVDPSHAGWVKKHWGDDYLRRENVFYRMLVIGGLTSRQKLLGDGARMDLLQAQVETLAAELDQSPAGLLDDYPSQCFPGDVMAAILVIRRADAVLGTDHSAFVHRAVRAFRGDRLASHGLPPFAADAKTGRPAQEPRGSGTSYVGLLAPELWPEDAQRWFQAYDDSFWQERWGGAGFREFAKEVPGRDWLFEVDAGPVLAGHGISASAFGVGAARKNGRFDRAFPLTSEMLATMWELPNGVLAGPRVLSNAADAPLLGEAAILWLLTVQPERGVPITTGGSIPAFVYVVLLGSLALGLWRVLQVAALVRRTLRGPEPVVARPRVQLALWAVLLSSGLALLWTALWPVGLLLGIVALALPLRRRQAGRPTSLAPSPEA